MPIHKQPEPSGGQPARPLPEGYRQGIITAITVLLSFSLGFLRVWGVETPGQWTTLSIVSAGIQILSILGQIAALYRALLISDNNALEYHKTVLWFVVSAVVLLVGLVLSFPDLD